MSKPSPEEQIEFLVKIQRLFSEGSFAATYKFALLQALADLSVEKGDYSGETLPVKTKEIAEKFIQHYWRQALPFISPGGREVMILKQNTGQQAAVINLIESARERYDGSLSRVKRDEVNWQALVDGVDRVVREMPLWRLQTIGNENVEFLYENIGEGSEIELLPGVAYNFRKFHSLIQDLVRGVWVRHIRSIRGNEQVLGESADLQDFLFGSERDNLDVYRDFLKEIQSGECFYCHGRIRGKGDVDHFIPWVRYPVDLGHNFVLTDSDCNRKKRDYLAAENHLESWFRRNDLHLKALEEFFDDRSVHYNLDSSRQVTCWAYEQAENAKAHVWVLGDKVQPIGTYWRNLCWQEATIEELAADKPD